MTQAPGWTLQDRLAATALFAFALLTNLTTVLNNAYSDGSTFFDSTIFQTIIWRSGLALKMAPTLDSQSFFHTHISPINYLPAALSYLAPTDRMTFYGLTYGTAYGALLVLAFATLRRLTPGRTLPPLLGAALFYLSGEIIVGQFEPHQEIASALFMTACLAAWSQQRHRLAVLMLLLNASVREDCGILLALPLLLLAAHDAIRTGLTPPTRRLLHLAAASIALSLISFTIKQTWFTEFDVMTAVYYRPWPNSFAHLSPPLLLERLHIILHDSQYLWVPGLVLCLGAILLRDARLAIAWIAYLPFWIFNFFSLLDLNAYLGTYKAFPFVLMLLWPAILWSTKPGTPRRPFLLLQTAVLLAACIGWQDGSTHLVHPTGLAQLKRRWLLRPETENAETYRALAPRLETGDLGLLRVSQGVLALYPYSLPRYDVALLRPGFEDTAPYLKSILWFDGDRDQAFTNRYLTTGAFPYRYAILGTKLRLASRFAPAQLPAFAGVLRVLPAQ
jgi:hypothetical protein